jgi:hypothetical protein
MHSRVYAESVFEGDQVAAPKAPSADSNARQRRPEVPRGRRPGSAGDSGERALALVRGYKSDVDRNRTALSTIRRQLGRGRELSEVRILDLLIWADQVSPS